MEKVITTSNLTKDYGNDKGIFNISFEIFKGRVVGFLGPNGAGKTTTIRYLLGLIKDTNGKAYINNLDCFNEQHIIQQDLGYLPGEINFIDNLKGMELIKFVSKMKNIKDLTYAMELCDLFELNPNQSLRKMSKGMKQKLGLILAFMGKPKVLILDEPSSGLDPLMQQKLIDLILKHKNEGATIFLSSHIFEEVEKTCDRVIMIKNGRIVADSNIDKLKKSLIKKYIISFVSAEEMNRFLTNNKGLIISDNSVEYIISDSINLLIKELSSYNIIDITKKEEHLEEVFMQYYGE